MGMGSNRGVFARAFGRGYFPYQFAWLIDNPLRRLLLPPARLARRLPLVESSKILEVGPGSGFFSVELASRVPNGLLELVDLQPEMLEKAKRKLKRAGVDNVGFTAHDATQRLPFVDGAFDVALLVAVLGEIPKPTRLLTDLRRILRPGGALAIHEHLPDPDWISPNKLRSLVETCGFHLTRYYGPNWNYTALFEVRHET